MRKTLVLCVIALSAGVAGAQPYFVRGEFEIPCVLPPAIWENSCDPMIQIGPNAYDYVVPGLVGFVMYEFKCTVDDWSMNAPGSNARGMADFNDQMHIYLYDTTTHGDGWMPEGVWRVGYDDSELFDWEIAGEMNAWSGGSAWFLTDMGGGIHVGELALAAGTYEWKFRMQGSWDISIGDDFGNSAANNVITVSGNNPVRFELDLVNGRWRAEEMGGCYPDCDQNGVLDIFDFLCFQNDFVAGGTYACDCDTTGGPGVCDIFDFLCFQNAFVAGCP